METGCFPALLGQFVGSGLSPALPFFGSSAFDRALVDSSGSVLAAEKVVRRYFVPDGR